MNRGNLWSSSAGMCFWFFYMYVLCYRPFEFCHCNPNVILKKVVQIILYETICDDFKVILLHFLHTVSALQQHPRHQNATNASLQFPALWILIREILYVGHSYCIRQYALVSLQQLFGQSISNEQNQFIWQRNVCTKAATWAVSCVPQLE